MVFQNGLSGTALGGAVQPWDTAQKTSIWSI